MRTSCSQCLVVILLLGSALADSAAGDAGWERALRESRIQGGLAVLVGPAGLDSVKALADRGPFLVDWLLHDEPQVSEAREQLLQLGLYGRVAVELWSDTALPYADNLVSLLIVLDQAAVPDAELLRVVRPHGELLVCAHDEFRRTTKAPDPRTDEWTHWRRAADRNVVSQDKLVDVPQRVQWLFTSSAVPERSHMVLTGGRAFAQDRDRLMARDAFNGLPLWRATLKRGNAFDWEYAVKVAALIVAKDERVYVLNADDKFQALDAATGTPVFTYDHAGVPYDILLVDDGRSALGTLVLVGQESIRALDAESGRLLWQETADWPHNTMASRDTVFYIVGSDRRGDNQGEIHARELLTGRPLWKRSYYWARRTDQGAYGCDRLFFEMRSPHNWREFYAQHPEEKEPDRYGLVVVSAKTGEELQKLQVGSSARHGEFRTGFWHKGRLVTEAFTREGLSIAIYNPDDLSEPAVTFRANDVGDRGFGHCYPPVLTDRYYLNGQLNFADLETQEHRSNQITRGACNTARSGYLPANGMLYTFPKHCVCFPMLDGNACLTSGRRAMPPESHPLVTGPAWPTLPAGDELSSGDDWPTFRHDMYRSGGASCSIVLPLETRWSADIAGPDDSHPLVAEWLDNPYTAGRISAPVIAESSVFVAHADTHRVIALDAQTGGQRWQFVAGGRIDGPPTIHRGMCLFGCRDGWVYNLRAADGELIWKLRIAPHEQRISVYGQLESPCPVAGSVLIVDSLAYVGAGLHPNADGGVRAVCFRPETGEIVWNERFDDLGFAAEWPDPFEPRKTRPESDPWRCIRPLEYRHFDLPVRDGNSIAVSRCLFHRLTGERTLEKTSGFYRIEKTGVYLPRTAWRYNDTRIRSPIAVASGSSVFSTIPGTAKLFRADFRQGQAFETDWVQVSLEATKAGLTNATVRIAEAGGRWSVPSPANHVYFNRAMFAAGDRLFVVAPSGVLQIYRTEDGELVGERKLPLAAWDGLAAAGGRLYLSTAAGQVLCLGTSGDTSQATRIPRP